MDIIKKIIKWVFLGFCGFYGLFLLIGVLGTLWQHPLATISIFVIIGSIIYVVYWLFKSPKEKWFPNEDKLPLEQRKFIDLNVVSFNFDSYQELFNELKTKYYNGDVLSYTEYDNYINKINALPSDKFGQRLLFALVIALYERDIKDGTNESEIQLHPREIEYFNTSSGVIDKISTILRNINYTGFRFNQNAFRSGNMSVKSSEVSGIKRFGVGNIYLTNQRLVIVTNKNKTLSIPLGKIVSYASYEDNGVLLKIENGKPIILSFPLDRHFRNLFLDTPNGILFRDDKIRLLYALDKVFELRGN